MRFWTMAEKKDIKEKIRKSLFDIKSFLR